MPSDKSHPAPRKYRKLRVEEFVKAMLADQSDPKVLTLTRDTPVKQQKLKLAAWTIQGCDGNGKFDKLKEAAKRLEVSFRTLYNWIHGWEDAGGVAAAGPSPGGIVAIGTKQPKVGDIVWYGRSPTPALVMKVHDPSNPQSPLDLVVFRGLEPRGWPRSGVEYSSKPATDKWSWPSTP
jgi:hypothetical protein